MRRIIIAEEEPFLARMLRAALVRAGYRVQTASDSDTAWTLLAADPPDAFITSATLAGSCGLSLCRRLRRDLSLRDLPTVIMTSRTDESVRRHAALYSHTVVLEKPVSIRNLLSDLDSFFAGESTVDTVVGVERVR